MAQETGWDLARVTRYAEPPLREREYVARCASEVQLHHARGSASLETVICDSLDIKPEEINWDSSYTDGQWLIQVDTPGTEGSARWTYEPSGKSVNPVNAAARTLMGLDPARETLSGSARESTIIVDTSSGRAQPQLTTSVEIDMDEAPIAPVRLSAVPELFTLDEPVAEIAIEAPANEAPSTVKKTRKGRAKVPSWDEILFGSSPTED